MYPPHIMALIAAGVIPAPAPAHAPGIMYGSDLDHLLSVSGAEPAYGLEIYGQDPYGAEAYGAQAYGSGTEIYGSQPASRSVPHWMHARLHAHHQGGPSPVGVNVQAKPGTMVRRFPLGFASAAAITAAAAATITAQPQVAYRPERLVVPSDIAGSFDITDVKVGKDSQFVAAGAIPARAFTETAPDNLLSFHGVAISQIISIAVVNTGGAALTFKALMVGTAVE